MNLRLIQESLDSFGMVRPHIIHNENCITVQIEQQIIFQVFFEFLYRKKALYFHAVVSLACTLVWLL